MYISTVRSALLFLLMQSYDDFRPVPTAFQFLGFSACGG